jgi:nucleoside-diphosphate-sugar epimerase
MEKRILVIGATGLLGQPVAFHLKQSGFIVRLMLRNIEKLFGDDFEFVNGDINEILGAPRIKLEDWLHGNRNMEK